MVLQNWFVLILGNQQRKIQKTNWWPRRSLGFYQNCRGLRTKLFNFKCNTSCFNYPFITLTETWLNNDIADGELNWFNYNIFRCDRNSTTSGCSRGGGALVGILLTCPNSPPQSYKTFMSTVENLLSIYSDHLFIFCGDFNLPNVFWSNDNHGLIYSSTSGYLINCLPETFTANNFFQINDIFNKSGSLLDLIFVKAALVPVVLEDRYHPALSIDFIPVTNIPQIDSFHYYFNFRKANYPLINAFLLSFNWLETFSNLYVTSAAYALFDALHLSILRHVPNVKFSRSNFPSWFTKELINLKSSRNL
ncbi:Reverse transcriptase domain-containing protein [Aphis craccivora]|uniref:Reverse transcriptase domain-containing protein n=1 Tax=Aphis craccivora TaxID=307492 RepID=A0A6G0VPG1_APHCR|nr:Reverse transcriptase domain-containing protein [Aphis craccivora]